MGEINGEVKTFAPQFQRDDHGWIHFPRDIERRRATFPSKQTGTAHDVFDHPAKMNLFLVESLVDYISEPGDWILDPFGGTGSTALAIQKGRHVWLIDCEEEFQEMIKETAALLNPDGVALSFPGSTVWSWLSKDTTGEIRFELGDNRQVLAAGSSTLMKACITSPPYSTALNPGSNPLEVKGREGTLANYVKSGLNMGRLNPFLWERAMADLWKGISRVMAPGGLVAMVNKDIVKDGQRELLSQKLIHQGNLAGLDYKEWFKWKTPGTIRQETARNKGGTVIEDEDIILMQKPR